MGAGAPPRKASRKIIAAAMMAMIASSAVVNRDEAKDGFGVFIRSRLKQERRWKPFRAYCARTGKDNP
jgi:hypothetical protein